MYHAARGARTMCAMLLEGLGPFTTLLEGLGPCTMLLEGLGPCVMLLEGLGPYTNVQCCRD